MRLDTRRRDPIDRPPLPPRVVRSLSSTLALLRFARLFTLSTLLPSDGNCDVRVICGTLKSSRSLSRPRPVACGSAVARQPLLTFLTIGSTRGFRVAFLPTPEIDRFPSFLAPVMDRGLFRRGNNLRFFPSRGASPASPCDDPDRCAYHVSNRCSRPPSFRKFFPFSCPPPPPSLLRILSQFFPRALNASEISRSLI